MMNKIIKACSNELLCVEHKKITLKKENVKKKLKERGRLCRKEKLRAMKIRDKTLLCGLKNREPARG